MGEIELHKLKEQCLNRHIATVEMNTKGFKHVSQKTEKVKYTVVCK